jgi:putative ABC transport system ATP-binding protein
MTPRLEARELTRTYGTGVVAVRALRDVSFQIEPGAMVCVTGRSGSGKSTLLRQLGLLDTPTSGQVFLDGSDVTRLGESHRRTLRLEHLGYVFQEYALLPELTAEENV